MLQSGSRRRIGAFIRIASLGIIGGALAIASGGCGSGSSGAASENQDACDALCGCLADEGSDSESCHRACAQVSVAATDPASACRNIVGDSSCSSHCSSFTDPAPGDQLGVCGGNGAMAVGQSASCDLGGTRTIDYLALSVGCNDGETGSFSIELDGQSVELDGDCGTAEMVGPFTASTLQIKMNSGGGSDRVISFSSQGSIGLIVGYR